jgi:putative endonuclease
MNNRRKQGAQAEALARNLLEAKGYRFIYSNYFCRWGEVDLVMLDAATLVFVEVRLRNSSRYGSALESISRTKQKRMLLTAKDYLLHHPYQGPLRFDVVGIMKHSGQAEFTHLENAIES